VKSQNSHPQVSVHTDKNCEDKGFRFDKLAFAGDAGFNKARKGGWEYLKICGEAGVKFSVGHADEFSFGGRFRFVFSPQTV